MSTGSLQDLLTETCTRSCKDIWRISPGPLQELLRITCARSCKGPWQHFITISRRASHKDLLKTLAKIFKPGPLEEAHRIVIKGPAAAVAGLTRS
jgi:hypothetical protein